MLMGVVLAGCSSVPPAPIEVRVPVTVPCVHERQARPEFEFGRLPATASDGDKVLALARDWPRGRAYEAHLEAIVAGCP